MTIGVKLQRIGFSPFDEPYQMLNSMDYQNIPLAPLSNYIGGIFGQMVNWEWLSFRYLTLALSVICDLIVLGYFWTKTRDYRKLLALTVIEFTFGASAYHWYGWDIYGKPFLVISIIEIISFIQNPRIYKIIFLGVLTSIIGLTRLPSFVTVFIVLFIIAILQSLSKRDKIKYSALYIGVVGVVSSLALIALFGSIGGFLGALKANAISDHSIVGTLFTYVIGATMILPTIAFVWCLYHIVAKSNRTITKGWFKIVVYIVAFWCIYYTTLSAHDNYMGYITKFINSCAFICIGAVLYYNKWSLSNDKVVEILGIFLLSCVPFFGSNTGIFKFMGLISLPLIMVYLYPYWKKEMWIASFIAFSGLATYYFYNGITNTSAFDDGLRGATYELTCGKANGLKTNPKQGKTVETIYNDFKPFDNGEFDKVILRNSSAYIYEYLFACRNNYQRHQFDLSYDDAGYVDWLKNKLSATSKPVAVLYLGGEEPTAMLNFLSDNMTAVVSADDHRIYVSRN